MGFKNELDSKIQSSESLDKLNWRNKDELLTTDVVDDDFDKESGDEDGIFDVVVLRRLVKLERLRADMANVEVEKERMAAASAADEAMSMIIRLQTEKSSIMIEANQYSRLTEQRLKYDQEVIQSLQWDLMGYDSDKAELEEKLRLYREKLKQFMSSDEMDQFEAFSGYSDSKGEEFVDSQSIAA